MLFTLQLKPIADEEIVQAFLWYEEQRINLGEEFLQELDVYFELLKNSPAAFGKNETSEFHQVFMKRFPYVVVYDIHPGIVIIYSVHHTSRNPEDRIK